MRDPARIESIIFQLRAAWQRYPDMRLGQLVSSAAAVISPENDPDPLYVEDDVIAEGLRMLADAKRPEPFVVR